jgi:hypothetical protein
MKYRIQLMHGTQPLLAADRQHNTWSRRIDTTSGRSLPDG